MVRPAWPANPRASRPTRRVAVFPAGGILAYDAAKKSYSPTFRVERMSRSIRDEAGGSMRFRRHQSRAAC
jgi:hypothetical protein